MVVPYDYIYCNMRTLANGQQNGRFILRVITFDFQMLFNLCDRSSNEKLRI